MKNMSNFMIKKRMLLISIFISQHTDSMDKPIKIEKKIQRERQAYYKELIPNTTALPEDIKKYIIRFFCALNIESDDKFITRVKTTEKKILPDNYYYKNLKKPKPRKSYRAKCNIPTGLCPYNSHVAISNGNHLQIINCENHSIVYKEKKALHCGHIALSSDTSTIATIHREHSNLNNTERRPFYFSFNVTNILTIKNIKTKKTELLTLPSNFDITYANYPELGFAFNKQGTSIIIRGVDKNPQKLSYDSDSDEPKNEDYDHLSHHLIIPVTINGRLPYLNKYLFRLLHNIMKGILPKKAKK